MSVESEIIRLQTAKADLKTSIEDKGVTVPSSTKLDGYADLVDSIQAGGGGENMIKLIEINLTSKGTSSSDPYVIDVTDKEVIYNMKNNIDDREYFRFNIEGRLSTVSSVKENSVLCWRYNGSSSIRTYTLSGSI
jgi:hypothetical protein